jgi:hypothetical protein
MARAALLLALLALAGCGGDAEQTASTTGGPADGIRDLDNVLALRSDFEADAGKPRVIVLFSPT